MSVSDDIFLHRQQQLERMAYEQMRQVQFYPKYEDFCRATFTTAVEATYNSPRLYEMAPPQPRVFNRNPCPHKTIPPSLQAYSTQLFEYYKQAHSEPMPGYLEGAEACCVLYYYKNLK